MKHEPNAFIWIFVGDGGKFPSGVFRSLDVADEWIAGHRLTGVLTRYPVDVGVFDWAVSRGDFTPSKEHHRTAKFIGRFSSAGQEHYHYEDGQVI